MKKLLGTIASIGMVSALACAIPLTACTPGNPDNPDNISYSVCVISKGGLKLEGVTVTAKDSAGKVAATAVTDKDGNATLKLSPANYTLSASDLPKGYTVSSDEVVTDKTGTSVSNIVCTSSVIKETMPVNNVYAVGDVMYDFTVSTPYTDDNGQTITYQLSDVLEEKSMVILNFWSTRCGPCTSEMPFLQEAYLDYSDKAEVIAANVSFYGTADSNDTINSFREKNEYTFPMVADGGIVSAGFATNSIPLSVIVDRYGVIMQTHLGSVLSVADWENWFEHYTADDYVQGAASDDDNGDETPDRDLPDVEMPSSDTIKAALSPQYDFTYRALGKDENGTQYCWPFVVADDGKSIVPSNGFQKAHNSYSMLYVDVSLKKGDVLLFDYKASTEQDIAGGIDILHVFMDGTPIGEIYGNDEGTFYAFVAEETDVYTLLFSYIKDSNDSFLEKGQEDTVYIKNLRTCKVDELAQNGASANILRHAATGDFIENVSGATMYQNYATAVLNEEDGYYHVGDKNGPLLLANLLSSTHWSNYGISDYVSSGLLPALENELSTYISYAKDSAIYGYCTVDATLQSLLKKIATTVASMEGRPTHAREWLEVCVYYDHYGIEDNQITDPLLGIAPSAAIAVEGEKSVFFEIRKSMSSRGYIYSFTPTTTGIYNFYSEGGEVYGVENGEVDSSIWLFESVEDALLGNILNSNDDADASTLHFSLKQFLTAGKTYYFSIDFSMHGDLGNFYFTVERYADSGYLVSNAAGDADGFYYTMEIIDTDPTTGTETFGRMIFLSQEVALDDNDVYHVVNKDGSLGSPIYMNLTHSWYMTTSATPNPSVASMVESGTFTALRTPKRDANGNIVYAPSTKTVEINGKEVTCPLYRDPNLNEVYEYNGNYYYTFDNTSIDDYGYTVDDLSALHEVQWEIDPNDYSDTVRKYINAANADGYIIVTKELADIIQKYIISVDPDFAAKGIISEENPNGSEGMINGENAWLILGCFYYSYQGPDKAPEYPAIGKDDAAIGSDIWYGLVSNNK